MIRLLPMGGAAALVWGVVLAMLLSPAQQPVAIVGSGETYTGQPMTERERFAVDLLAGLGNPQPTTETIAFVVAWQGGENTAAAFNPLATTQPAPGDTCFNYINGRCGVRNYPDYETGLRATIETMTNGFYPRTYEGLVTNAPVADDGELGTWGTGADAVRTQWAQVVEQPAPPSGASASNPIAIAGDDCGWNVQVALDASGGSLRDVRVPPGSFFSFNGTMGDPAAIPYRTCAGVPGGNWCNLAARYAQVTRALGLVPEFQDHGIGDLGGGPENSVSIWNVGGQAGEGQDLIVRNTTDHTLRYRAEQDGANVIIVAWFE